MGADDRSRLTIVKGEGGVRFAAEVRGHVIHMDQPVAGGGQDSAPGPLELLGVALGGCVALYATQYCATRGLPHEGITVEVATATAKGPYRIASFDVAVHMPEPLAEEHRLPLQRAVLACPAHNTLAHPPAMAIRIVEPALAERAPWRPGCWPPVRRSAVPAAVSPCRMGPSRVAAVAAEPRRQPYSVSVGPGRTDRPADRANHHTSIKMSRIAALARAPSFSHRARARQQSGDVPGW